VLEGSSLGSWAENAKKEGKNIREYKCEGGESWIDTNKRASKLLKQIVMENLIEGKEKKTVSILVITHGGFIMEFNNVVSRIHKKTEIFDNSAKNCSMFSYLITYQKKGEYDENQVNI
jgi:broad specificity phosphatase PhoE